MFFDPNYFFYVFIPTMLLSLGVQIYLKRAYAKWSKVANSSHQTGMQVSQTLFGRTELMDIPVEVVPGVTAAAGVAAYAGIPLTHRDRAQSVVFTTGFLKNGALDLDWEMLARPHQTVVIYMGVTRLAEICAAFVAHGLPASTPAAVIERGTTHAQRVVAADLATLAARVREAGIRPPALTVVGEVVGLYPRLAWFQADAPAEGGPLPHAGCAAVHPRKPG